VRDRTAVLRQAHEPARVDHFGHHHGYTVSEPSRQSACRHPADYERKMIHTLQRTGAHRSPSSARNLAGRAGL
jgi:hypothetical protein